MLGVQRLASNFKLEVADGQCTVVGRAIIIVVVGLWSQCILLDTNALQFLQLLDVALSRLILITMS